MLSVVRIEESSATSYVQEFSDLDEVPTYEELPHERWLDSPDYLPGRYAAIFQKSQSEVDRLKSMKPRDTCFTHKEQLWTYDGKVRIATSGHGDELEPHFKFSTSPHNSEYFPARYVLDYLELEEAGRDGMI